MATFQRPFANLSRYQQAAVQPQPNVLDSFVQALNQGISLAQLPQTIQRENILNNIKIALEQQRLQDTLNPAGSPIRKLQLEDEARRRQQNLEDFNAQAQKQVELLALANPETIGKVIQQIGTTGGGTTGRPLAELPIPLTAEQFREEEANQEAERFGLPTAPLTESPVLRIGQSAIPTLDLAIEAAALREKERQEKAAKTYGDQFVGFAKNGRPLIFNPSLGLRFGDAPEGVTGPVDPKTTGEPSNIFLGNVPGGGFATMKSKGDVAPTITQLPGGGPLLPKIPEAISETAKENVAGALRMLDNVDDFRAGLGETGRVQGIVGRGKAFLGEGAAATFQEAESRAKADIQSLIKGIPSNFDAQMFAKQVPSLTLPEKTNIIRINKLEQGATELLRNTISYWKSRGQAIPVEISNQLLQRGIDPDTIQAWDGAGDPITRGALAEFAKKGKKSEAPSDPKTAEDFDLYLKSFPK